MLFMFPGQGSQKIGMGKDLYDAFQFARDVFHEINDALSFNLSNLIFLGSDEDLKLTENAQPALMAVSMAFVNVMKKDFSVNILDKARFLAGHSLGEYIALCAAGVISLSDTAKLLRVRGLAMAAACKNDGAMAAILGLDIDAVEKIFDTIREENFVLQIANDNSNGQVVISGHKTAVEKAIQKTIDAGAKKAVLLEVSGPFHCALMKPAVESLEAAMDSVTFNAPIKPIISNITAKAETDNFKKLLLQNLVSGVRWRESILFAAENSVSKAVEIGSGKVLTGLVKRVSSTIECHSINSLESMGEFCRKI
ncbi:malonyl CoA-acyl carrier protein transacylase [Alphaproteobacteria bacterium]|nr:malonyl CoA-acyl carrier protein transacylase [Alphaproteobacteria bacterium]